MADNPTVSGTVVLADEITTYNGSALAVPAEAQEVKLVTGPDGQANPFDLTLLATQSTLAAVLAKLSADPASQTTVAAILVALQGVLSTAPTTSGDVANTLTDGRKTVTTPGVAVPLVNAATPCRWVVITALKSNTDQVNVGGSAVTAVLNASTGSPLSAGESVTIPVNDAQKVFVDARVTTEGVSFTVAA